MSELKVIRNHDGKGACGCAYDEGAIMEHALQRKGHRTTLLDPDVGLNGAVGGRDRVVLSTQAERYNALVWNFFDTHPATPIAWRPGWKQLPEVELTLRNTPNLEVVHLCMAKAVRLTTIHSLPDAALVINAWAPRTLVIVTDPSGAAACRQGHVTHVLSHRLREPKNLDGNGAAFFGGFLGELFKGTSLPVALWWGHYFGAAMASGRWPA